MLKNADKYETSSHFSYNEYKKKVKKSPNSDLMVFLSVFIIGLLIILGFAKILSPNVDVGINVDDEEISSVEDSVEDNNPSPMAIDERLRRIQMEDEGKAEGDEEMFLEADQINGGYLNIFEVNEDYEQIRTVI